MSASDALWLKFWGVFAGIGFIIVIIGVIIEGVEHFKKFPKKEHARKLQIEKIGWFMVVAGLAMEFLGDSAAKRISNREDARLNNEAADAWTNAAASILLSKQIETTNAQLVATNLVLQAKLQPRIITPNQVKNFIFLTEKISKNFPIKICVGQADEETESYAYQIRQMLNQAGFKMDSSAGLFGITRYPNFRMVTPIGATYDPDVSFFTSNTNFIGIVPYQILSEAETNGVKRPVTIGNTAEEVYEDIQEALDQIKIPTHYHVDTNSILVNNGEFAFLVGQKK